MKLFKEILGYTLGGLMFGGIDWFICGPIAMTALFLGISIPLMEKRQLQNKSGYAEYRKQTRVLI